MQSNPNFIQQDISRTIITQCYGSFAQFTNRNWFILIKVFLQTGEYSIKSLSLMMIFRLNPIFLYLQVIIYDLQ